jgi:L-2-hydroxyglutarate oxidase LhgO
MTIGGFYIMKAIPCQHNMECADITIVGGGVVGCAIAYELSKIRGREVFLLEKNPGIRGDNQSSRNSGVIHAGIYYSQEDESLKARLCVQGNSMLYDFCREHSIPHNQTGKLVVATNHQEEEYLDDLLKNALRNNVPGIRTIPGDAVKRLEPNVSSTKALLIPSTGVLDQTLLVGKLYQLAEANGAYFLFGNELMSIRPGKDSLELAVKSGESVERFETRLLINSAGLYSDQVAKMLNPASSHTIKPILGEWARFYKTRREELGMNGMNVYPAPYGIYTDTGAKAEVSFKEYQALLKKGKVYRSIGIHLSPTLELGRDGYEISDSVIIGPTSTVIKEKEDFTPRLDEDYYAQRIKGFFPGLKREDIELHQTGIRAKLASSPDFVIERDQKYPMMINLIGIDSPGLTASLAIARHVKDMLKEQISKE